jgi:hypothetical protein
MNEDRPIIYAIDFDGTIAESKWPDIGRPVMEVVGFIRGLQVRGDKWILWSMREDEKLKEAMAWLAKYGLRPDAVNDNLPELQEAFGNNPRKVFADIYIDDHNAGGVVLPKRAKGERP